PDVFVLIDVPEAVIDERLKYRRVCPACKTSRNLKLFPTKEVGYDQESKEFYLICDNPNCKDQKLVQKEGDELGIQAIRERLITDEKLIKQAFSLYGIPKVLLRNSIPVAEASKCIDDYESTPEYSYEWLPEKNEVKVIEKPLQFQDDRGVPSYSLLAASVVLSLIKQMAEVLQL
ncbi:nucleoside monophosphate kinase, partial [Patescibacteria group bacterium]|nr:nucleoside monophosphate kinase [Patescibacteria group bacterium]